MPLISFHYPTLGQPLALWLLGAFEEAHTADIAKPARLRLNLLCTMVMAPSGEQANKRASLSMHPCIPLNPVPSRGEAFVFEVRRGDRNIRIALSAAWRWTVHDSGYHAISNW